MYPVCVFMNHVCACMNPVCAYVNVVCAFIFNENVLAPYSRFIEHRAHELKG